MKLEEAIETIKNSYVMSTKHCLDDENIQLKKSIKTILKALKNKDKVIVEMKRILNQWMPLAECSYWNYKNHTCTHTCRGCDFLSKDNRRTNSGVLIDNDRYCRLYEDGYANEDTVFVKIEDLILGHGTKNLQALLEDK